MSPFITLTGQSNRDYVFTVLPLSRKLPASAGLFVVTSVVPDNEGQMHHTPLRIGSCRDLSKLFDQQQMQELRNEGLHKICVKIEEIMENRQQMEQDLKAKFQL